MQIFKPLILTDHRNHSTENSLYPLARVLSAHPACSSVDVATRGNAANDLFFHSLQDVSLSVHKVEESFTFTSNGLAFQSPTKKAHLEEYDAVWLRLPPPLSYDFLHFLKSTFPQQIFINDPIGIYETGSKEFLLQFPSLCPPMKMCRSIEDIVELKNRFPIVLKPLREYGGKGLIRIDGQRVWAGQEEMTFSQFVNQQRDKSIEYLGVSFLKNVAQGDKRIVVVGGQIMGASLRLPAADSWLCNVAMGGRAIPTNITKEEQKMVEQINPILAKLGILMYGLDTLVGDDGKRVLSEINTTSIGGLPQMARDQQLPLVEKAIDIISKYIQVQKKQRFVSV